MRFAGSVVKLCSMLMIFSMGLAATAQAARVDRKTVREERALRVRNASHAGSAAVRTNSSNATPAALLRSESAFVQRLISGIKYSQNYERKIITATNKLIARDNQLNNELNNATNPNRINGLSNTEANVFASIARNLTYLNATQPVVDGAIGDLSQFRSAGPGIAANFNRLVAVAVADQRTIAAISAFVGPVTPSS
jgi:hypothetical protein